MPIRPCARRLLQALQFRVGLDVLPGKITSAAFNGLQVNVKGDRLWTRGIQVDLGSVIWSARKK
jgi:hypothetical protein